MIRKITLLFFLSALWLHSAYAQPMCGDVHHLQALQNPQYKQSFDKLNNDIANWINSHNNINSLLTTASNGDTIYEIPVVVHVLHTGGNVGTAYNPTDGRIDSAIRYTNLVFEANWGTYPKPGFGGTKFPFRFALAKRAPNCTATTGITRTNVSTTYSNYTNNGVNYGAPGAGVNDITLKAVSIWPNDKYYNIWVVNRINGVDGYPPFSGSFIAGYAYFPNAPADRDGTIMLASQMKEGSTTLPHELAHAFGIYHTFEGDVNGTTCPPSEAVAGSCAGMNDFCCDTKPHQRLANIGSCPTGATCVAGQNYDDATAKNIMNYTNCPDRFTPDQRDRFLASLVTTNRGSLISSSGSLALPTTTLPTACAPAGSATPTMGAGPSQIEIYDANRHYMNVDYDPYDGTANLGYMDYTCHHQVRLKAGNTYSFRIRGANHPNTRGVMFIDYNNDGLLGNSTGERITGTISSGVMTGTFTVPATAKTCAPVRLRVRNGLTTGYIDSCTAGLNGQTEDYEALIYGSNSGATAVKLDKPPRGGNPSCFGTELMFKARPTNTGITVVKYKWFRNSVEQSGQATDSFKSTIFADNDTVKAMLYYTGLCGVDSVMSDSIVVDRVTSVAPTVTIGITGGTNPTCIDDTLTFSVVANTNPGGGPTYQWRSNGNPIPGATGPVFKAIARGGERITVQMTSSSTCAFPATAVSNEFLIAYTTKAPVVNVALTIGTNPGCQGQALQFTATPVTAGGTAPAYQWLVNGAPVTGTGNTYNSSTLNNNDQVSVIMTSNSACATPKTATSTPIAIVHEKITADIMIAQSTGVNPTCQYKKVIFSANTTNAGKNPTYQWLLNGQPVANAKTPIYLTDSLKSNDIIQCVLIATDPCVTNPLDTSNSIVMMVIPALKPKVEITITAGKNPGCLDSLIEFTAVGTDLGTLPEYTWLINGFPAANGNVFSTTTLLNGNTIILRGNQTDGGCYFPDTVFSAPMVMVRSITPKPPVISLIGNLLYTNFDSSFVWFGPDGQMPDGPKGKAYPNKIGPYYAVTNNNGCWSVPSNILRVTLLDISSLDITGLDVYPNPVTDKLVLDWKGQVVNYTVTVHNSIGQIVMSEKADGVSKKELNFTNMATGNYFIMLKDAEGKVGVVKVAVGNK